MNKYEWSTLVLRVVLGATFMVHGLVKFQGGIENTVGWFTSINLPGFLAYGVAFLELIGGIALVIGLATRVISALFALLMVGAILKVKLAVGFLGNGQMAGYELDLAFLAISVFLAVNGNKLLALDQVIARSQESKSMISK